MDQRPLRGALRVRGIEGSTGSLYCPGIEGITLRVRGIEGSTGRVEGSWTTVEGRLEGSEYVITEVEGLGVDYVD